MEMINESNWSKMSSRIHKIVEDYVKEYGEIEIELSDEEIHAIYEAVDEYKADEVDTRIQELEEEVGIYKDLCTAYRIGDSKLADKALTRLEALKEPGLVGEKYDLVSHAGPRQTLQPGTD